MMSDPCFITVDGRRAEAPAGAVLLDVIREMGIHVPTLCHHPSVESSGACRLCLVEITHPDWKGWSGLVASCLYPVEPGLEVLTCSDRVLAVRRTLLEMLLARCPDAEAVRALARAEGIEGTPFPIREGADKCVLCGLCVRVCQDLGPAALAPLGRGAVKEVGPRPDKVGEDCTGCGACALICPTGEIRMEREPGKVRIWNRDFAVPAYRVEPAACRGCGVCEEVCPLAIPRVVPRSTGALTSLIAKDVCAGCGLCAGACPAGAIALGRNEELTPAGDLAGKVAVFACPRSPFPPDRVAKSNGALVQVPCVGRVSLEQMLECLARGADGVLVLGRDKETCPHGAGEDQAAERARVAAGLAAMAGLGDDRVRFALPPAGYDGPAAALAAYRGALAPTPLRTTAPAAFGASVEVPSRAAASSAGGANTTGGLDRAREVMQWLLERNELRPALPPDLAALFGNTMPAAGPASAAGPGCADDAPLLYLGDLPVLDRLLSLIVSGGGLRAIFEDAAALLDEKGIRVRPVLSAREVAKSTARRVIAFCECCLPDFGRPVEIADGRPVEIADRQPVEIVTLDALAGYVSHADAELPLPPGCRFAITPQERAAMAGALQPPLPACRCPGQAAQIELLGREGSWQSGALLAAEPFMAFQKAVRSGAAEGGVR